MSDWENITPSLEPVVSQVEPLLAGITSVLDFLIGVLNIVQKILNVVKSFTVGLLSPIQSLLEMILEEVRGLISDLRQMGVYLTGDWDLLTPQNQYSDLLGGYAAYERRMLFRLLDRTDASRPDFSQSTSVVGAFFYVSSEDVSKLAFMIRRFMRFFGQEDLFRGSPFGTPTSPTMRYGTEGAGTAAFRKLAQSTDNIPDLVSLSWASPSPGGGLRIYSPAPSGFLIHVSTIPDGFRVVGLTSKADTSIDVDNLPRVQSVAIDPNTNGPVILYGGLSDIGVSEDSRDFSTVESDDPRAHSMVLVRDQNSPLIKPSLLIRGDRPLVADTFYVKTSALDKIGPSTQYTATLRWDDLPLAATFKTGFDGFAELDGIPYLPSTYYVRIRALGPEYTGFLSGIEDARFDDPKSLYSSNVRLFQFSRENLDTAQDGILYPESTGIRSPETSWGTYTPASGSGIVQFPNAAQKNYLNAAKAALAVAILCRADLSESDSEEFLTNTYANGVGLHGLEQVGRDLFNRFNIQPVLFMTMRPQQFRVKLRWALAQIMSELQENGAPPDSVVQGMSQAIDTLLNFRWSEAASLLPGMTILDSIQLSNPETEGIGANPYCRSLSESSLNYDYRFKGTLVRGPSFTEKPDRVVFRDGSRPWIPGEGSADYSPIVYSDSQMFRPVQYARNILVNYNEGEVVRAAATVLQVAAATISKPGGQNWIAVRLMPQAFVPIDNILESVERYMEGINDGVQGVVDKITAYIDATQARIYQIQALLEQIKALLAAVEFFSLPSASGLLISASGTDGLAAGLVSSTNKPLDNPSSYGGGIAVVAGGLPTLLVETITLILSGGEE